MEIDPRWGKGPEGEDSVISGGDSSEEDPVSILRGVWHQGRHRGFLLTTGCSIPPAHTATAESLPHLRFIPMHIETQRREGWERGRLSTYPLEMRKGEQPTVVKRIRAQVLLTYNHTVTAERH